MYVYSIEELQDASGNLLAYGIWKFTQDAAHSDTALVSAVMAESKSTADSLRATRVLAARRKTGLMREARAVAQITCDSSRSAALRRCRLSPHRQPPLSAWQPA